MAALCGLPRMKDHGCLYDRATGYACLETKILQGRKDACLTTTHGPAYATEGLVPLFHDRDKRTRSCSPTPLDIMDTQQGPSPRQVDIDEALTDYDSLASPATGSRWCRGGAAYDDYFYRQTRVQDLDKAWPAEGHLAKRGSISAGEGGMSCPSEKGCYCILS